VYGKNDISTYCLLGETGGMGPSLLWHRSELTFFWATYKRGSRLVVTLSRGPSERDAKVSITSCLQVTRSIASSYAVYLELRRDTKLYLDRSVRAAGARTVAA
jgi:hypothetical protein